MIKKYIQIIKPRIVLGNLFSFIGGFLLNSKGNVNYILLITSLISILLLLASSCLLNNIIDYDIDQKMERTKHRAFAKGLISIKLSLICAICMSILSFVLFYITVNVLTMGLAIVGFIIYVIMYSLYLKRKSIYSILIGSVSGALPPVIGYCAVNNKFDLCAFILISIFYLWQIPHFYSISILHYKDYKLASIPILLLKKNFLVTKHHINFYIICFTLINFMLTLFNYTGYKYLFITTIINLLWLYTSLQGYLISCNNAVWAKKLLLLSILSIMSINFMMSIDYKTINTYN